MWSVDAAPRGCLGPVVGALGEIFDARPPAETVRSPAWALLGQVWGVRVDTSNVAGCQEGSGRARNRARALLNWFRQGQPWGRCRVMRRALRVMRPAREKKRRRIVLVVVTGSPSPMRVVQRAKLCAMTRYRVRGGLCTASQAALAGKRPDGSG